ncbi:hypothetical protein LRR81_01365 [Metabacillus sp. GX 13764]|uniref:tetratricopeptide repeat protein n=1 Tax=Metabacillus kandeliae TaxID=2900151 RepID=UPI001E33C22B|nr:hypothetical protein [Metabacillus kandeliae]MCD7032859.1 hypothetical protein [Metabacillus kandeliae]
MRNKAYISMLLTCFVLTGCTEDQYDEYILKGKTAFLKQDYQGALINFNKAANEKSDEKVQELINETNLKIKIQASIKRGKTALESKEYVSAIKILSNIVSSYNDNTKLIDMVEDAQIELNKAKLLREESLLKVANSSIEGEDYDYATKMLSELLVINESNENAKKLLKYIENINNGSEALDNKLYDKAVSYFTIALNAKPNDKKAEKLKGEALNDKEMEENIVNSTIQDETEINESIQQPDTNFSDEDNRKIQFVKDIQASMEDYYRSFTSQLRGSSEMISTSSIKSEVRLIYSQALSINVPYPNYQPIKDNWLHCLEETNKYLENLDEVSNGNLSAFAKNTGNKITVYYEKTQNGLDSIK